MTTLLNHYGLTVPTTDPSARTAGPLYAQDVSGGVQAINDAARGYVVRSNGVDDTAAINAALALTAPVGDKVILVDPDYYISGSGISSPLAFSWIESRTGDRIINIHSSVTSGYSVTLGSRTGAAYFVSCGFVGFRLYLSSKTGNGVEFANCDGARWDFYCEGIPPTVLGGSDGNTSTALFLNGGSHGSQLGEGRLEARHILVGCYQGTTGAGVTTSVRHLELSHYGDDAPGSSPLVIDASCSDGTAVLAGNWEHSADGARIAATRLSIGQVRFENPTNDLTLLSGANGIVLIGCNNLRGNDTAPDGIVNSSGNARPYVLIGCTNELGHLMPTTFPVTTFDGNVTLTHIAAGTRYILLDEAATTGILALQAGDGSAAHGGGVLFYGSSHATHPGDVAVGLGGTGTRKFRVKAGASDGSTDLFTVDQTGAIGVLNAAAATTPGSVVKKLPLYDTSGALLGYLPIYSAIT